MTVLELISFKQIIKEEFPENFQDDWELISSWSSMQMLLIMTAIDEQFKVLISHEDFKKANSVDELFEITRLKNN
jgi:acyl carrier protein|tara:strand:- start:28261 stop:28485 length:225 start_codon:yes stop_codon:yes gene_type:complete